MSRKYIDCREFPSESNCTIAISADSEDELIVPVGSAPETVNPTGLTRRGSHALDPKVQST